MGGHFLIAEEQPEQIRTPEELPAEARLMAKTMEEFLRKEVLPVRERLEAREDGLMRSLVQQAGRLGLLGGGVPETYGGLELSRSALALLAEKAAVDLSFAVTIGVHSGVALLPLLYFGTPEQKEKYLPALASGESIGAFALSEADSGSDAFHAQTRATLEPDGKRYLLRGAKMWTTNGGFADLFTVFAQVDGEQFTAFLVERDTPGLVLGREEEKMGLHGSSTRRVLLEDTPVPAENVIGEVGKGHLPALYALNVGRFQIAATALGAAKECLRLATQYAAQRVQFGRPISEFGLIRQKLAGMAVRIFLLESMLYRVAGYWEENLTPNPFPDSFATLTGKGKTPPAPSPIPNSGEEEDIPQPPILGEKASSPGKGRTPPAREYVLECALLKFFGTEVLDYVVDEALQIHGGYGYSEEFPIARMYRDARVFRIFEGTNEINRLTVTDQLLRRARQSTLPFSQVVKPETALDPLEEVGAWARQIRRAIHYVLGASWTALEEKRDDHQEVEVLLADMTAALFALESAWLRACKLRNVQGSSSSSPLDEKARLAQVAVRIYGTDACAQVMQWARTALSVLRADNRLRASTAPLRRLSNLPPPDAVTGHRQIADPVVKRGGYPW